MASIDDIRVREALARIADPGGRGDIVSAGMVSGISIDGDRVTVALEVDPALIRYAVQLTAATRDPERYGIADMARYITFGASPRASINLILTARALAFVRGREYALPQDVRDMALDVMRHRLVLSYLALSDNVTGDELLTRILDQIPIPEVPLNERANTRANNWAGSA